VAGVCLRDGRTSAAQARLYATGINLKIIYYMSLSHMIRNEVSDR